MKKLALLLLPLLLTACNSTGGIFLGLVPLPKFTKGTIEAGLYRPKDESFAVWAPYSDAETDAEEYEWTYTKITERTMDGTYQVDFGPGALDASVFSVAVYPVPPGHGTELTPLELAEQLVRMSLTGEDLTIERRGRSLHADLDFVAYTRTRAGVPYYWGATYVGQQHGKVFMLSMAVDLPGTGEALLRESWEKQRRFLRSFEVAPPVAD